MKLTKRCNKVGSLYEQKARDFLTKNGLVFIEKNARSRYGEIDLIMQHNDCIVFIEVRFRRTNDFGGALFSIDQYKQKKLLLTASCWLVSRGMSFESTLCRFDVFVVTGTEQSWIQNVINVEN